MDCLHPLKGWLKTSKPLFIYIANCGFLLCASRATSSRPWEACNYLQHLAFRLQILCCDCWGKLFMVLVFLSVKLFIEGVYWIFYEARRLILHLTYHRTFIASAFVLLGWFLAFFLCRDDFKTSSILAWCQYDLVWPSLCSFHSNLQQVKSSL